MLSIRKQSGATLVELMISVAIGMVSVLGVASLVGMGVGVNSNLMNHSRLGEELKNVVNLMARDIRRAGYNGNSVTMVTDPDANPSAFANSISVSEYTGEATNSCLVFAYDADSDGVLDTSGTNENYGYRLRDGAVEMRKSGLGCTEDGWEDLTESAMITVNALTFTVSSTTVSGVVSTSVNVSLTGTYVNNTSLSKQYNTSFLIRSYD